MRHNMGYSNKCIFCGCGTEETMERNNIVLPHCLSEKCLDRPYFEFELVFGHAEAKHEKRELVNYNMPYRQLPKKLRDEVDAIEIRFYFAELNLEAYYLHRYRRNQQAK